MPHRRELKVFIVSDQHPTQSPQAGPSLSVEASSLEGLRAAAQAALRAAGYMQERALSFTPSGLVAYVWAR